MILKYRIKNKDYKKSQLKITFILSLPLLLKIFMRKKLTKFFDDFTLNIYTKTQKVQATKIFFH